MISLCSLRLAGLLALATALATPAAAQPEEDFFRGKQLTLIIGSSTGGGYDTLGRLVARHIGRHLAGNPTVVVQNMPGAGSIAATNHLYAVAPKDGTTIALVQREVLTAKLTNVPSVRFDIEKFNWIGNIDSDCGMIVAWHASPIASTQDLFAKEMIVGGTGPMIDTETLPRLLNTLIGTKFRIVSGYPGTTEVVLAMERGEVMGIGDWSWSSIKANKSELLSSGKIRLLMQASLKRHAELPNVPSILDFARNNEDRQLMEVFLAQEVVARPLVAPPDVPAARIALLRAAFSATAKDPDYLKDTERARLDLTPMSGEEVTRVVASIIQTPKAITDRMIAAIAPPK